MPSLLMELLGYSDETVWHATPDTKRQLLMSALYDALRHDYDVVDKLAEAI